MSADEIRRRLRFWGGSSADAEGLAAQVLAASGYEDIDPSHPRGGPDGGQDVLCTRDRKSWVGAVHFPNEPISPNRSISKLKADVDAAQVHGHHGMVFVTNQALSLAQREELRTYARAAKFVDVEVIHLERVAHVLRTPGMSGVIERYLGIGPDPWPDDVMHTVMSAGSALGATVSLDARAQVWSWPAYVEMPGGSQAIAIALAQTGESRTDLVDPAVLEPSRIESGILIVCGHGVEPANIGEELEVVAAAASLDIEPRRDPDTTSLAVSVCRPGFREIHQSPQLMLTGGYGGVGFPNFAWWDIRHTVNPNVNTRSADLLRHQWISCVSLWQ